MGAEIISCSSQVLGRVDVPLANEVVGALALEHRARVLLLPLGACQPLGRISLRVCSRSIVYRVLAACTSSSPVDAAYMLRGQVLGVLLLVAGLHERRVSLMYLDRVAWEKEIFLIASLFSQQRILALLYWQRNHRVKLDWR